MDPKEKPQTFADKLADLLKEEYKRQRSEAIYRGIRNKQSKK